MPAPQPPAPQPPAPVQTILVVDDDEEVREVAAAMFEQIGLTVLQARSGDEALRILDSTPAVNLLFSDIRMPGMSGPELAEAARQRRPELKVVLTSGYYFPQPIDYPVVKKPFGFRDIQKIIK